MPVPTSMSAGTASRRRAKSGPRRAGDTAQGALLLVRLGFMALLALLLLVAGVWGSWKHVPDALASGDRVRGTMTVRACDERACTGTFQPSSQDEAASGGVREVVLRQPFGPDPGESLAVAVSPGDEVAARTGFAGVMYAWLPLAGALLLASIVLAGGLRLYRTAWVMAGAALAALLVTFAVW